MKVGVFGGTFDPIHLAHLRLAEEAADRFKLDRVEMVLSADPPHKTANKVTPVGHRWAMLNLACRDNPRLHPCSLEIDRPGKSYTVDTLEDLRKTLPERSEIFLLMGADSGAELQSWKDHVEILESAQVVVATRGGEPHRPLAAEIEERILRLEMTSIDLSSTRLRKWVRMGRSIRYLAPDEVLKYISEKSLYLQEEPDSGSSVPSHCEASG